jgi:hypothetical protein
MHFSWWKSIFQWQHWLSLHKLVKSIFIINQARNFLSPKTLKVPYLSLVHPHLLYCVNIYSFTFQTKLNRITKLQKKAICVLRNVNSSAHTEPLFHSLGILPLNQLIKTSKTASNALHISNYSWRGIIRERGIIRVANFGR